MSTNPILKISAFFPRWTSIAICGTMLVLASCQTATKIDVASLPPSFEGMFTICSGGEGSLSVSANREGEFLGTALFDWVSDKEHRGTDWNGEFRSALGQAVLNIGVGGHELAVTGPMAKGVPPIKIRPDGFLIVDGHFVAIKAKELPCFFKFKFPREWLNNITSFQRSQDSEDMESFPEGREVIVHADGVSVPPAKKVCAEVSWRTFLGMIKSTAEFCHKFDKQRRSTLKVGSTEISWIDIDEQTK